MSVFVPPTPPRISRDGWEETLLKFVERLVGGSVSELDAKLLLALATDREQRYVLIQYVYNLLRKELSDLDIDLLFMLAEHVENDRKGADNVSG